ncbi:hypothetical protein F5X98DRAFT_381258 [Xylaria grammica]|nr:hypothetical protein F5X98DRAFT_381258 [Xylaria grammica]
MRCIMMVHWPMRGVSNGFGECALTPLLPEISSAYSVAPLNLSDAVITIITIVVVVVVIVVIVALTAPPWERHLPSVNEARNYPSGSLD